jgi:hypothetical protein
MDFSPSWMLSELISEGDENFVTKQYVLLRARGRVPVRSFVSIENRRFKVAWDLKGY